MRRRPRNVSAARYAGRAALVALAGLALPPGASAQNTTCHVAEPAGGWYALIDVAVVDYEADEVRTGQTIVVRNGKIDDVGPLDEVEVPAAAERVDGCGLRAAPGLADMHVHVLPSDLSAYLANGVTTVRNMWGYPGLRSTMSAIDDGTLAGPTIYSVSSGLDGNPPKWPHTQLVLAPGAADSIVDRQYAQGWRTLKVYSDLGTAEYDAIVDAAKARRMDFVGHVPWRVGLRHALAAGQRSIEHMSGYEDEVARKGVRGAFAWVTLREDRLSDVAEATRAAGAWNCPTLAIFARIARGNKVVVENRRRMVAALHFAGAPLLVGTDSGIDVTPPGASIHEELAEFVAAGISRTETLRIATAEAARFLGREADFGRIVVGQRADIVLLGGDPRQDLDVLRDPVLVIAAGRVAHRAPTSATR